MTFVKIGSGRAIDTVNIFHAGVCNPSECPYYAKDQEINHCIPYNGDKIIEFPHGISRDTLHEVMTNAPCAKERE